MTYFNMSGNSPTNNFSNGIDTGSKLGDRIVFNFIDLIGQRPTVSLSFGVLLLNDLRYVRIIETFLEKGCVAEWYVVSSESIISNGKIRLPKKGDFFD